MTKQRQQRVHQRAAVYVRVSTDRQASDGNGLGVQQAQCKAMIEMRGWQPVGEFADNGASGLLGPDKRGGLHDLLEACERGAVDVVVVASLSRLGRSLRHVLDLAARLETLGVDLASCSEAIDTTSPTGRFTFSVLGAVSQLERDLIVERTTNGRNERGRVDGERGGSVPYGYKRISGAKPARIVVNQDEAVVLRRVFALRPGHALQAIADALIAEGVPTRKGKAKWHCSAIRKILKGEAAYRGGQRGASKECWPVILGVAGR